MTKDAYKEIACDHLPELSYAQAGPLSFSLMWHVVDIIPRAGHNTLLETHFYRSLCRTHPHSLSNTF